MFAAVICCIDGSFYYQPFNTCCELRHIQRSLGPDYEIVDIFYRGI